ncbi:anti-sigma factor [Sphingomonas morindae]|uniref:Anti-sigma factor n=1 Tax=Sphingomonas morindae TaxID=1541170 RepID=A0ABY4X9A8_9SPHN|nr:anti-sigma factor [Sphingomonas morindae]USI73444.1 anti-sigma factor [Sphingomonas morindae]
MSALGEEEALRAAELALGLLDGAERAEAEARLARDPIFAEAHARWRSYAAQLFSDPDEVPRPSVWTAIAARLPANDAGGGARAPLRFWQAGTAVASAAALVLGLVALQRPAVRLVPVPAVQAHPAPMAAVLTGRQGFVTIGYDPARGRMIAAATGLSPGDRVPELWVIPADGKPRAIGVPDLAAPAWTAVPARAAAAMARGVTIAVSLEPRGGSPTGQPTGPVILTGTVTTS